MLLNGYDYKETPNFATVGIEVIGKGSK